MTGKQVSAAMKRRYAEVFAEWQRRFRDEPERFATEMQVASMGLTEYGDQAAAYFAWLLHEMPATHDRNDAGVTQP